MEEQTASVNSYAWEKAFNQVPILIDASKPFEKQNNNQVTWQNWSLIIGTSLLYTCTSIRISQTLEKNQ